MRTLTLLAVLGLVLPGAAWADEGTDPGALPPPRIVPHGQPPAAAPEPVPAPVPVTPAAPPVVAPTPTPQPPPAAPGGAHLRGTSIATPVTPGPAPTFTTPAPTQREIQQEVDAYLQGARPLIEPLGAAGTAGYDQGFWIRGGGFSLKTNLVLQARYEAFLWEDVPPTPGGDLSGFSFPRAALIFSGRAQPAFQYHVELDFGSHGGPYAWDRVNACIGCPPVNLGPDSQSNNWDPLREAWIEWNARPAFNVRGGLVPLPTTRQLMVRPELQQFADISLASAWVGLGLPGYTDRNRDYGVLLHGVLGNRGQFQYALAVTNGDGGDHVRNVLDPRSSDNLAYGARLNWAFLQPVGYQEGALRQVLGPWYGEIGAWASYYADRLDLPHSTQGDYLRAGVDLALGYRGWSFTGAYNYIDDQDVLGVNDDSSRAWLAQLGYHLPGSAWELAARWSGYDTEGDLSGDGKAEEYAVGLNYYLNGHGNKLQVDVAYVDTSAGGFLILDPYAGYPAFLGAGDSGLLLRFQWQLAL